MKKNILILLLAAVSGQLQAQHPVDSLIAAEKNFAAYSKQYSTKEAFEAYIDSNSWMFEDGAPVKAMAYWAKREKKPALLQWWPLFADIAGSGDFGFTTGPWTYQARAGDSIIARGQYATVWHRNEKGQWKFLADLGADDVPETKDTACLTGYINTWGDKPESSPISKMLDAEKSLIRSTSQKEYRDYDRMHWYRQSVAHDFYALLIRNGQSPAWDTDSYYRIMRQMPDKIGYTILGSGIASSGDMGYVFGATLINGKKENYLRIWRFEKNKWKLTLEVLHY